MKNKTFLAVLTVLFLSTGASSLYAVPSELELYNNLNIYSNAGYYPGVVVQAELLESNYPESVFIVDAGIAKGQALTILKRYEEAEQTFAAVLSSIHFGARDYSKCCDALLNAVDDFERGFHSYIAGNKCFFEIIQHLIIDSGLADNGVTDFAQYAFFTFLKTLIKCLFLIFAE